MLRFQNLIIGKRCSFLYDAIGNIKGRVILIEYVHFVRFFLVFSTIGFVVVAGRNPKYLDPDWKDPHGWSAETDPLAKICPQTDACKPCDQTVRPEYLRLVNTIFDPSAFRVCKINFYILFMLNLSNGMNFLLLYFFRSLLMVRKL